jgi:hypothetical protein
MDAKNPPTLFRAFVEHCPKNALLYRNVLAKAGRAVQADLPDEARASNASDKRVKLTSLAVSHFRMQTQRNLDVA